MVLMMRQERIRRGWTQEYVAQKCGVSMQTVCDWEKNRRKPSYDVLVKLENLFGLTHRELFGAATPAISETPGGNRANREGLQN